MIHHVWRLSEGGEGNLGVAVTGDGLVLGRTPLVERREGRFVARDRSEIERLLCRAYRTDLGASRFMPGLATVAAALNANDPCLAQIAAVHLRASRSSESNCARCDGGRRSPHQIGRLGIRRCIRAPGRHPIRGGSLRTGGAGDDAPTIRTAQNDDATYPLGRTVKIRLTAGSICRRGLSSALMNSRTLWSGWPRLSRETSKR